MFVSFVRSLTRLSARCRRYGTCWCPEEPFDSFTRVTYLPNGVRVLTEENYSPLACVSLFVIAGSRYETANCNGLTHFIEHLVYKGFKSMPKSKIEHNINALGAKMLAKTGREMQMFSFLIPSECAVEGVMYLSKIMLEITLDEQELEKERHNLCLEAIDLDNDPKAAVFDYLHKTAFQGTPLAQPVMGPTRNIARFDKLTTAQFLCENYSTCRLILATSGYVRHDEIVGAAGGTFGCLSPCGEWVADSGPTRFTGSEVVYRDDSLPFCHVAIGMEAPGYNSDHYYKMLVMKHLIGSYDQSQRRPENQPFYSAQGSSAAHCVRYEAFYIPYKDIGLWGAYFIVDKHHVDDMLFIIQDAWMQLCLTTPTVYVERAINMAKLELCKEHYGVLNSCRDMGTQMVYACRRHPLSLKLNLVEQVTVSVMSELAHKFLYNQNPAVAAIGPTECLPEYNRIQSGMYWLRW